MWRKRQLLQSLEQVVAYTQCIRHDRQSRIHCAARREKACIDGIEILKIMSLAVDVEYGALGIPPESKRPVLMRHARQRDTFTDIGVQVNDFFRAIDMLEQTLELCLQALVSFFVVRFVAELDLTLAGDRHPVVRIGQIFRCHPEVQRVFGHEIQGEAWNNLRRAGCKDIRVGLTDERYVAHWEIPLFGWEVKVVQPESLLEESRVFAHR